jgi:fermentation-respiration switch protein FrsA (DUF1100 family)
MMLSTLITAITGDPTKRILQRRSTIESFTESTDETTDGYKTVTARIRAASGLEFDMSLRWPAADDDGAALSGASGGRPLVLILGGQRSGNRAAALIKDTKGAMVAALSYPYHVRPWPSGTGILLGAHKIHSAFLDTPAAIMLALDYIERRGGPKIESVDLVGVSLGVPFVCVAAALDGRFDRVWSIHGAGEPFKLLEHNLRVRFDWAPVRKVMAFMAHIVASGRALAPERWVGRISPRPFLMINAINDARIPRSAAMSLYQSAREPKELHWMEGDHVAADREDVIIKLCDMIFRRLSQA